MDERFVPRRRDDIPIYLKWTLIAINRVGFPIIAAAAMWWLAEVTIKQNTQAIGDIKNSMSTGLSDIKNSIDEQNKIMRRRRFNNDGSYIAPLKTIDNG